LIQSQPTDQVERSAAERPEEMFAVTEVAAPARPETGEACTVSAPERSRAPGERE
jgi:hypothetical protein